MRLYYILKTFTRTEKNIFWGAFLIFMITSCFWGVLTFYSKTVEVPVSGGQYTEGIIGQPSFINPVISGGNEIDNDLSKILFADLITLSDNYKTSDDGKTWSVYLKSDLLWSDNKSLTSDDVIFTIETIQDPNAHSPLYQTWQGVVAERVSELEIEFSLRNSYAFFLDNLKDLKVIPKHIFGTVPPANIQLSDYNLEPVGSGPYKFISYKKRKDGFITEYKLAANEYYASDKPFIKDITVKFFPTAAELIKAFNTKKIDGFGDLNPKNINDLQLGYQLKEIKMPRYYAIFFNSTAQEILKDKEVKTALELATDKKKIVEQVFGGKALIINQALVPMVAGYIPDIDNRQEFSIEKSRETLEANGWLVNNETGIREHKNDKGAVKLEIEIVIPQIPFLVEAIDIVKQDWLAAGIELDPILLNPTDINERVIKTRNYQALLFGNILKNNPDIFSFWHSSEKFYPGLNLSIYDNKKVDELLESIRKNPDPQTREKDLETLQTTLGEDMPALFLFSPIYLYVGPKNLMGFEENVIATPSDRFENINKWYLKKARVFK